MELLHAFPAVRAHGPGSVVTIGSFDGVHVGHQRLLRRVRSAATREGLTAVAVTFDPHPRCVVDPSGCPPLLSSLDDRVELLGENGADSVVVVPFTPELSAWSADRFATTLTDSLGMRRLIVGPGFALGRGREGNLEFLGRLGARRGFKVTTLAPAMRGGRPSPREGSAMRSSPGTSARRFRCWGTPYVLEGVVERGEGRGAGLGVPTANIGVDASRCIPAAGVYAGWLNFGDGWRAAATGNRDAADVRRRIGDRRGARDRLRRRPVWAHGSNSRSPAAFAPSARSRRSTSSLRRWLATLQRPARSSVASLLLRDKRRVPGDEPGERRGENPSQLAGNRGSARGCGRALRPAPHERDGRCHRPRSVRRLPSDIPR